MTRTIEYNGEFNTRESVRLLGEGPLVNRGGNGIVDAWRTPVIIVLMICSAPIVHLGLSPWSAPIDAQLGPEPACIHALAFDPSGALLAAGDDDGVITLWDVTREARLATFPPLGLAVRSLAFSPDGRWLASVGADASRQQGELFVWDVGWRELLAAPDMPLGVVHCAAFTPDGASLLAGGADGRVSIVRTCDWTCGDVLTAHADEVLSLAIDPAGAVLATGGADQQIFLWDAKTWNQLGRLPRVAGVVRKLAFSRDGKTLASVQGDEPRLRLWNVAARKQVAQLATGTPIRALALGGVGGQLILATGQWPQPGEILAWAPKERRVRQLLSNAERTRALALDPTGRFCAIGTGDGRIRVWRLDTGELACELGSP